MLDEDTTRWVLKNTSTCMLRILSDTGSHLSSPLTRPLDRMLLSTDRYIHLQWEHVWDQLRVQVQVRPLALSFPRSLLSVWALAAK